MTVASQEGDFVRTSHGPQPPLAPQVLRAGAHRGSHACDLSIRYFMPRSHEAFGQSTDPVNTWEITWHALRVRTMF